MLLLSVQHPITTTYQVEASGWDSAQSFFVEKSELEWNEQTGKCLTLSHSLCPGSMIFLRLLQASPSDRSLPVAYQTEHVGVTPEGQQQFRLKQFPPSRGWE
jgi:hypothetical protein